jgi:hypothetical protein
MFTKQNVYGVVQGFGVRVKDEREHDRNHLVEVGFEIPLTFDLAHEIMPAMARDLFISVKGSMEPRPEMQEAIFTLTPPQQVFEARNHPEMDPEVSVEGVTLRKIKAVKNGTTWVLRFVANWTLGRPEEVTVMIQRLKLGLYLSFREQQPTLKPVAVDATIEGEQPPAGEQQPALALVPKKRGRPKKQRAPEADRAAQVEEGRRLAAGEPEPGDGEQEQGADPDADPDAGADAGAAEPAGDEQLAGDPLDAVMAGADPMDDDQPPTDD